MDRFIDFNDIKNPMFFAYLKSNMDRFIESTHENDNRGKIFKIQYG